MPQSGLCVDSKCDGEIRRLYECHCCSQFICLTHLNEHEEKEKFHSLIQQLKTKIDWIQLSIENRLKRIEEETIFVEQERKYLQQANQFLDGRSFPIEDIQKILQDFNQLVQSHSTQENVVKMEPLLSNCSSSFQSLNHQNECSLEMIPSESKLAIRLDLTENSDEKDKDQTNEEMECSSSLVQTISMNLSDKSLQENDDHGRTRIPNYQSLIGLCPLKLNGAYGFSREKHSIDLCSGGKLRSIGLYSHLIHKHKLKSFVARRLIDAVVKKQDPMTTILFDDHEEITDHSLRIECPFKGGMIRLFDCQKDKNIARIPCRFQSMLTGSLRSHLKKHHNLSGDLAKKIVQHCEDNRTKIDQFQL